MKTWYIPDAYYPSSKNGEYVSHEAVCMLNTGSEDAEVRLTLYFEDREKLEGFFVTVPAERTIHCRMDKIRNQKGEGVPTDTPYAIKIESEKELTVRIPEWIRPRPSWRSPQPSYHRRKKMSIDRNYEIAKELYAAYGIDTDAALKKAF